MERPLYQVDYLSKLADAGHISQPELEAAGNAARAGSPTHSIGFEAEVLLSAADDTPKLAGRDLKNVPDIGDRSSAARRSVLKEVAGEVAQYNFRVGSDGLYELISPAALHPYTLNIAMRGIAHTGWLPDGTRGLVAAHASIGAALDLATLQLDEWPKLITMLRAIEMCHGTTPNRLMAPIRKAEASNSDTIHGWNMRGRLGVDVTEGNVSVRKRWEGDNSRIEFRTLGYYGLKQFGLVLDNTFYLSRGALAVPNTPLASIYGGYDEWLADHFATHNLPDPQGFLESGAPTHDTALVREYIEPYASHLASGSTVALRQKTAATVMALREELGMSHIPLSDAA